MSLTASFDDDTGKVTLTVASAPATTATVLFQRSLDSVTWTDVRGAQTVPVASSAATFLDYEYRAGLLNNYRAVYTTSAGASAGTTDTTTITPGQTSVWLKNPLRPFLNRVVTVVDFDDVTRQSRSGVFDVIGRTLQVARTDLMSGRSTTVYMRVTDQTDADDLDGLIAVGEVLFLQAVGGSALPTMYAVPGNSSRQRVAQTSAVRRFPLPLTEVAVPDLTLAAVQSTWQTVVNTYSTWQDLVDAKATWGDVLLIVGTAADVVTS